MTQMQTINPATAQQLAQELVAKTQQIKALSAEVDLLKLEIYDAAQGGIRCTGALSRSLLNRER
jgi:hypothetical protein